MLPNSESHRERKLQADDVSLGTHGTLTNAHIPQRRSRLPLTARGCTLASQPTILPRSFRVTRARILARRACTVRICSQPTVQIITDPFHDCVRRGVAAPLCACRRGKQPNRPRAPHTRRQLLAHFYGMCARRITRSSRPSRCVNAQHADKSLPDIPTVCTPTLIPYAPFRSQENADKCDWPGRVEPCRSIACPTHTPTLTRALCCAATTLPLPGFRWAKSRCASPCAQPTDHPSSLESY